MTMFTLPNFCRVCLKYDKNLIDLAHIENEPSETLMSKLQLCVSEVEWTVFKPLLCHPCIKRLNIAYGFKKQCVQSSGVLKNYVELVKESQKKNESQNSIKTENIIPTTGGAYMLLPNQKYVKILVGGAQNQPANTFQNVFLNLIPTTTINSVGPPTDPTKPSTNKDTNQNVFFNLNNTFQKYIPVSPSVEEKNESQKPTPKKSDSKVVNVNVNKLLTETKTEELSVEIDPTIFGLEEEGEGTEEEANDYDEVISPAKITLKDFKSNGEKTQNGKDDQKYFVPILPKTQEDFFSSGQHFLFSSSENSGAFACERCQKLFTTKKLLKAHINQFHLGKLPFKCEYCYTEFTTRVEYDHCVKSHQSETDSANNSLTLQDFANSTQNLSDLEMEANNIMPSEDGEYICDVCCRPFHSSTGLLRHKVRKHNQKTKKKYFIKGMKNARCDICNRDFSTQSYMQLHKKLHMRDDIGYKYKVFGKSKYGEMDKEEDSKDQVIKNEPEKENEDSIVETLDVTPDIFTEDDKKSDDESNEGESRIDDVSSHDSSKMEVDEETASDNETQSDENSQNGMNSNPDSCNKNGDQGTKEKV